VDNQLYLIADNEENNNQQVYYYAIVLTLLSIYRILFAFCSAYKRLYTWRVKSAYKIKLRKLRL